MLDFSHMARSIGKPYIPVMYRTKYKTLCFCNVCLLSIFTVSTESPIVLSVDIQDVISDDVHVSYRGMMSTVCNGENNRFQILMPAKLSDCVIECALREHCLIMNYKLGVQLCELYHLDELSSNVTGICFRVEKNDIVLTETPCEKSPCFADTVCDRNTKMCSIKECLIVPNITDGRVLGNLRNVGNIIRYVCNHGFKLANISNATAVCLENGSWSAESSCVANVKLNEECPNVTTEDSCMDENAACLPHDSVNVCQCIEGYIDNNGDVVGGNCIPKSTIGELCNTSHSQCAHPSLRCVHEDGNDYYCHCQFGYEFDQTLGICVKVCSAYSNNSSEFHGEHAVGIDSYNIVSPRYAVTLDECVNYCTENAPLYLSIDIRADGLCNCNAISKQQCIKVYGQLQPDTDDWTFYDRPCATTV